MTVDRLAARSFGVQYVEGPEALGPADLAAAPHEALILEPLNYATGYDAPGIAAGAADLSTVQAGGKQVFLYMSVGETSDLRGWWDPAWTADGTDTGALTGAAPDFISEWLSGASGGQARLVKFWTPEWLAALQSEIDFLVRDLGADGIFLDNVASYFEWLTFDQSDSATDPDNDLGEDAAFYASAMSDLVVAVSDYARSLNPDVQIIANGDPFLPFNTGDRAGKGQAFLDAISGMLQEGVYHSGGERVVNAARDALRDVILADGVPVLALDYVDPTDAAKVQAFVRDAVRDGFLPYAEELDLAIDGLQAALNQPTEQADALWLGPSTGILDAGGGADVVTGSDLADAVRPGGGDDAVDGGGGTDAVHYSGTRASVFVSATTLPGGAVSLATTDQGTDLLESIETIVFDDQTVSLAALVASGPDGRPSAINATVAAGRVSIAWDLFNDGDAPLPAGEARFELIPGAGPAILLGTAATPGVAAGDDAFVGSAFDQPAGLAPGGYAVRITFDPDDLIDETDEADNVDLVGVNVQAANGAVSSLAAPGVLAAGAQLTLTFTIANNGDLALPADEVTFFVAPAGGGAAVTLGPVAVGAVAPGGSFSGSGVFDFVPGFASGDHVVTAFYDPDDSIPEFDEADNSATSVPMEIVGAPNGVVSGFALASANAVAGDAVSASWTLANAGGDPLPAGAVAIRIEPAGGGAARELAARAAPGLAAGASAAAAAVVALPDDLAPGSYLVRLIFDPADAIAELSEADNAAAFALEVSAAPEPEPEPEPAPAPLFTDGPDDVTLTGPGPARALGGDDRVIGGDWRDDIFGGPGEDLIRGRAGNDRLDGKTENDRIRGDNGDDLIYGRNGDDRMWGGRGADEIYGGRGEDLGWGGEGRDRMFGRQGDDKLKGGKENDRLDGNAGDDRLIGGLGHDDLFGGNGRDLLKGGNGDDYLVGGRDLDRLFGGRGADELEGNGGDDRLFGEGGEDILNGGNGRDRIVGGRHDDILTGGRGDDLFEFARRDGDDDITDFRRGDRVDLSRFGYGSAAEVLEDLSQEGADVELDPGFGLEITFLDMRIGFFREGDFIV